MSNAIFEMEIRSDWLVSICFLIIFEDYKFLMRISVNTTYVKSLWILRLWHLCLAWKTVERFRMENLPTFHFLKLRQKTLEIF